jgi:hypothetical protein
MASLLAALLVLLLVSSASADSGLPLIAWTLPSMLIALVPVVLFEAWVYARLLKLTYRGAAKIAALSNVVSTVIGIPLAWVSQMGLFYASSMLANALLPYGTISTAPTPLSVVFYTTFGAPFLAPIGEAIVWMVPAATLVSLVPYFFVSWLLEYRVTCRLARGIGRSLVRRASFWANVGSYSLLAFAVVVWLITTLQQQ